MASTIIFTTNLKRLEKNTIAAVPDMFSLDGMAVGHLGWKIGAIPTGTMTFFGLAKLATFHF